MKTKLLIFGITGDLSTRKLLPAIKHIIEAEDSNELEIIGVSRREVTMSDVLQSSLGNTDLLGKFSLFTMNVALKEDYGRLREFIALKDDEQLLIYLSVPPQASTQIVDFLGEATLNMPNVKLLFEKPFGVDLASAAEMISRTARYFEESQLYRIDHYLAKEMAQNIVTLRGGNALFEYIWQASAIEKIEIVALESITIEGRAQFYEQTGALRDFLQGHLIQLLALTLIDIPHNFDWNELPTLRLEALKKIQSARPENAARAQYKGYEDEVDNVGSRTETFVSVQLTSSDKRWKKVPIQLVTGKALREKKTEIRIHLRKFHEAQSNCITLRIQPNEGVEMELFTKKPGYDRKFETQKLSYAYASDTRLPDAYEHVLIDAIHSRKSLFASSEEVLESWRILQPLQQAWANDNSALFMYSVGESVEQLLQNIDKN
jgi:glucose-6-phosphate 1-dehydrogenase